TFDEGVGASSEVADGEIVPALVCSAASDQRQLTARVVGVAPIAADFGNRMSGVAIFDRDGFARFPHADERAGEIRRAHLADPDILGVLDTDRIPGVLLVVRIISIKTGFTAKILHAYLLNPTGPGVGLKCARAQGGVKRHGERGIERDSIVLDFGDDTIKADIHRAGDPVEIRTLVARWKAIHAKGGNPSLRARMRNDDGIADPQPLGRIESNAIGANSDVRVTN